MISSSKKKGIEAGRALACLAFFVAVILTGCARKDEVRVALGEFPVRPIDPARVERAAELYLETYRYIFAALDNRLDILAAYNARKHAASFREIMRGAGDGERALLVSRILARDPAAQQYALSRQNDLLSRYENDPGFRRLYDFCVENLSAR